ncbi:Gfo/Idh/MocA family oxidoreductase, partial [Candidatus Daviesbacteria bacterium]|nr:Gfo/Idh/MocA family oxidoreductase [Candidatus Daviesbacteria bacterium]
MAVICDKDSGRQEEAKLLYPRAEITGDVDHLFNHANLDAIIIASPAFTHYELAVKSLKAGKHLLVEKPLTLTTKEAENLIRINDKAKKIVMVGHTFEYNPMVLKIKKIIKEENFGKIYYIYSTRVNLGQIRGDVNALWNLAPHDISIFNFILDEKPEQVMAAGASFLQKDIEDVVFVMLRYPNNILAEIHLSWLDPAKERKVT